MLDAIEPGRLAPALSAEDYHADPALGNSGLGLIERSIAHLLREVRPSEDSPALLVGSALHCAVLEPDAYHERYAAAPEVDRRTKEGKATWAEFVEQAEGRTVLTSAQSETIEDMSDALREHPTASRLLAGGAVELSAFWDMSGIACKCRPDHVSADGRVLADLKTTQDASPEAFAKSCANFAYHRQAAWYTRGWEAVTGLRADFVFVTVEKAPPYGVACYTLDAAALAEGWLRAQESVAKYRRFLATPAAERCAGYDPKIRELALPRWAFRAD